MRIILQDKNELLIVELPKEINGNYWVKDTNQQNLVNIVGKNNKWIISGNEEFKILKTYDFKSNDAISNLNMINDLELSDYLSFYIYELESKIVRKIFCFPTYEELIQLIVDINKIGELVIGNDSKNIINVNNPLISKNQITIKFSNNTCKVINNNLEMPMYINDLMEEAKYVCNGDMVFVDGFVFSIIGNVLLINNPNNIVTYDSLKLTKRLLPNNPSKDYSVDQESFIEVFNRNQYFQRPPRFKRSIEEREFKIDPPPPSNIKEDEMPLIYTMGPMMLMGITSIMSGFTAVQNVMSGQSSFKENATPIITSIAMLGSMLLFPFLQKMYTKKTQKKRERKRRRKYKKYLQKHKENILQDIEIQRQILIENNLNLVTVARISLNKERRLWERKMEHDDFLNIRLGIGSAKPKIKIDIPQETFTMDEDDLRDLYVDLFDAVKDIENVPVTIDLVDRKLTGMIGNYNYVRSFLDGFLLQLMTFHSYDMLKIAILTSDERKSTWEKYKNIPHFWNNDKSFRFMGIGNDNINKVSNMLIQIFNERMSALEDNKEIKDYSNAYRSFKEYYLIITDEIDYIKGTTIYNELIKQKGNNIGFSFIFISDKVDKLPNECTTFINLEPNNCGIFENELVSTKQSIFVPDIAKFNMNICYMNLCNIPVDIDAGKFSLPKSYSFLEMYDVGNVNQLNILNRWKNNNIIQSLAAPVGVNEQGELFKIDLHEKVHGPHGLVAGMTGSGKSEWIITYILSMCINYHPDEVQFVLIDYKGGGLAGTFENKETGIKIPHLAGTITNLDVSEINRSLASINSELKRRQSLFNQARDKLGESSVDIYKYQRWYRENKIDEPISHLFIISDEFAELKSQQPEFMEELISTARIGRSLGVHLILATQKPSGVVDDQIWSNSKFRVCLKVQDKSDSNDMIRVPDAAMLKETGRFYLQVGYNEFFAKGQSAYAGSPYYESDKHKKTVDTDISFVDDVGEIYKDINSEKKVVNAVYKGEELPNILKEIINAANSTETHVKRLWLDAIPANIYVDELKNKYEYKKENYILNPIIGEYDAPQYQKQALLTLPLTDNGNTLIYGVAGSGKEKMLTTIIYSLMMNYTYKEVNVYVLDCGAEVLNCFKKTPIIGDIVTANEEEKTKNYFKFLFEEFETRKKEFQDYNGDYLTYVSKSGNSKPQILTIINNFENFYESYGEDYVDMLIKLTREAEKYGMLFIMTVNSINGIKYRLSQNFKQNITLQLNDPYDYKSIFGNIKIVPSAIKGRGIIEVNKEVFEFQVADPVNSEDLSSYLANISLQLYSNQKDKAPIIKTLPEVVDYEFIKENILDLTNLPIGVETETLEIYNYNMLGNYFNVVTSTDSDLLTPFMRSLIEVLSLNNDTMKAIVYDGNNLFENMNENVTYISSKYTGGLKSFSAFLDKVNDKTKQTLVFFTGVKNIISSNASISKELENIFNKISKIDKVNVIFIDSVNDMNEYNRENFFSKYISKMDGIYVGSGVDTQYIIEPKKITREMREDILDNNAYVIRKGKAYKIQLLELFKSMKL